MDFVAILIPFVGIDAICMAFDGCSGGGSAGYELIGTPQDLAFRDLRVGCLGEVPVHDHSHHHHHHHSTSNIQLAFALNLCFTIIELVGGILTNSTAILADAIHDLGDTLALGLSVVMERVSKKKRDPRFSFGYRRFSLLSALINGVVLLIGAALVLREAIPRLWAPEAVHASGMFWLAILGVAVNGFAALRLSGGHSMNEKMLTWHLLEDVLGWVAVLILSIVLYFWDLPILDPIFSMVFTSWIAWNVIKHLKQTLMIFLQSVPDDVDIDHLTAQLQQIDQVEEVHDLHVWSLDGTRHVLSAHLVFAAAVAPEQQIQIKQTARALLKEAGIHHATLELEQRQEDCELARC